MKTIRQLAEELSVSKQAIRNEITKQGLQGFLVRSGNQFLIDEKTEKLIKSAFITRRKKEETESDYRQLPESIFARELDAKNAQIAALTAQIERMQAQLEEQDKRHAETIEKLTQALERSQALHAGTLAERIETKDETVSPEKITPEVTPDHEEPRRHWWQFWK